MTITTLYQAGQTVYFANKSKVRSGVVAEIHTTTFVSRTGIKTKINYRLENDSTILRSEETLFDTEEKANEDLEALKAKIEQPAVLPQNS